MNRKRHNYIAKFLQLRIYSNNVDCPYNNNNYTTFTDTTIPA